MKHRHKNRMIDSRLWVGLAKHNWKPFSVDYGWIPFASRMAADKLAYLAGSAAWIGDHIEGGFDVYRYNRKPRWSHLYSVDHYNVVFDATEISAFYGQLEHLDNHWTDFLPSGLEVWDENAEESLD